MLIVEGAEGDRIVLRAVRCSTCCRTREILAALVAGHIGIGCRRWIEIIPALGWCGRTAPAICDAAAVVTIAAGCGRAAAVAERDRYALNPCTGRIRHPAGNGSGLQRTREILAALVAGHIGIGCRWWIEIIPALGWCGRTAPAICDAAAVVTIAAGCGRAAAVAERDRYALNPCTGRIRHPAGNGSGLQRTREILAALVAGHIGIGCRRWIEIIPALGWCGRTAPAICDAAAVVTIAAGCGRAAAVAERDRYALNPCTGRIRHPAGNGSGLQRTREILAALVAGHIGIGCRRWIEIIPALGWCGRTAPAICDAAAVVTIAAGCGRAAAVAERDRYALNPCTGRIRHLPEIVLSGCSEILKFATVYAASFKDLVLSATLVSPMGSPLYASLSGFDQ